LGFQEVLTMAAILSDPQGASFGLLKMKLE
jgi:hypothetical protein